MRVGVPTEVKNHEYRVAITPAGVNELTRHGHDVLVQAGAGLAHRLPTKSSPMPEPRSFPAGMTSGRTRS